MTIVEAVWTAIVAALEAVWTAVATIPAAVWAALVAVISTVVTLVVGSHLKRTRQRDKQRDKHRAALIVRWRERAESFDYEGDNFLNTGEYSELREYLTAKLKTRLETDDAFIVPARGRDGNAIRSDILDAISDIKRKWKLE